VTEEYGHFPGHFAQCRFRFVFLVPSGWSMLEFAYFEYAFFHIVIRALNLENSLVFISHPSIQVVICLIVEVCLANEKKSSGILLLIQIIIQKL
jgi:hypothetical protein